MSALFWCSVCGAVGTIDLGSLDSPILLQGDDRHAYLVEDKDQPGKWWCFYKQSGASMSWSRDLQEWTYFGRVRAGENACVMVQDGRYYLFHSPSNGIGIKISDDLKQWHDRGELITLGQRGWEWARGQNPAVFSRQRPGIRAQTFRLTRVTGDCLERRSENLGLARE